MPPPNTPTHTITHAPPPTHMQLLPGAEVIQRVNRIHEYIYDCWIAPYPVVQDFPPQVPAVFPLPSKLEYTIQ